MGLIIIPEAIILEALEKGLKFIRTDFNNVQDETDSYLYQLLEGVSMERYNYFKQAKAVFLCEEDNPRKLNVDFMYNMNVDKVPSIYVALSSEQNGQNGLGLDQGYMEPIEKEDGSVDVFTRRENTSYSIMITSDNSNEVVMIYHIVRALLLSLTIHLNLKGLENISIGGQDLQLRADLVPKNLFMRALNVSLQYEFSTPDLTNNPIIKDLFFLWNTC